MDKELDFTDWKDCDDLKAQKAKNNFRTKMMEEVINQNGKEKVTTQTITENLVNHCVIATKKCRDFMEQNPGCKQPTDYKLYPGKFDHTTCVAFRIGDNAAY